MKLNRPLIERAASEIAEHLPKVVTNKDDLDFLLEVDIVGDFTPDGYANPRLGTLLKPTSSHEAMAQEQGKLILKSRTRSLMKQFLKFPFLRITPTAKKNPDRINFHIDFKAGHWVSLSLAGRNVFRVPIRDLGQHLDQLVTMLAVFPDPPENASLWRVERKHGTYVECGLQTRAISEDQALWIYFCVFEPERISAFLNTGGFTPSPYDVHLECTRLFNGKETVKDLFATACARLKEVA